MQRSNAMFKGTGQNYEQLNDAKKFMLIFDGTVPTEANVQALIDGGVLLLQDLLTLGTLRVGLYYAQTLRVTNASDLVWPLAGAELARYVYSEGPTSFFIFCYTSLDADWHELTSETAVVHKAFIGTADDTGQMVIAEDIIAAGRYSVSNFVVTPE